LGTLEFSRLSAFVVDDNDYIRSTVENLLRQFRFGRIASASNGEGAIDHLKMAGKFGKANVPDIIISDLVMAPINGLLFLRWTRSAKESPNRMIPFIMLSGAADIAYVNSARDLGTTEFLAKPFSAASVYRHILQVIERPRQFITTTKYFGPDRRRRKEKDWKSTERRKKDEKEVTIVYSADKVVKPKKPSDVWYFRLPNSLKEKAGGANITGPAELPTELLAEAEEQLQRAALDFSTWALEYLAKLSELCTEALNEKAIRTPHFQNINLLALELRGQGGTFGYPLISTFGKMLYDTTLEGCPEDDNAVEIVKAHIDAMRAVLRDKIIGDGGGIGRELTASLNHAVESRRPPPAT
jgi:CheY-like chemotaxis protein